MDRSDGRQWTALQRPANVAFGIGLREKWIVPNESQHSACRNRGGGRTLVRLARSTGSGASQAQIGTGIVEIPINLSMPQEVFLGAAPAPMCESSIGHTACHQDLAARSRCRHDDPIPANDVRRMMSQPAGPVLFAVRDP
jgi:hypothetical protein